MTKNSSDLKRRLKIRKRPKTRPKRPTKQGIHKIGNPPKSAAPKMSQNGRKAIRTCNLPHSEAVKANDPNAWVPAHEIFLPQRFGHAGNFKIAQMLDLIKNREVATRTECEKMWKKVKKRSRYFPGFFRNFSGGFEVQKM
jgi:hypothetical protein